VSRLPRSRKSPPCFPLSLFSRAPLSKSLVAPMPTVLGCLFVIAVPERLPDALFFWAPFGRRPRAEHESPELSTSSVFPW